MVEPQQAAGHHRPRANEHNGRNFILAENWRRLRQHAAISVVERHQHRPFRQWWTTVRRGTPIVERNGIAALSNQTAMRFKGRERKMQILEWDCSRRHAIVTNAVVAKD